LQRAVAILGTRLSNEFMSSLGTTATTMKNRQVQLIALQMSMVPNEPAKNVARAVQTLQSSLTEAGAAPAGVQRIALLPELFAAQYFPVDGGEPRHYSLAVPSPFTEPEHWFWREMASLCRQTEVVLAVSFFEQAGGWTFFNSLAVLDPGAADLFVQPVYRKLHIPHSPGYHEKFYFSPGDTPPTVYQTSRGIRIGVGICWDQWFPELARCLALNGAEVLLYPTAIGSEPQDPTLDSREHWRRTQQGHAAANLMPLMAANRTGIEHAQDGSMQIRFYGSSFITDNTGAIVAEASRDADPVVLFSPFMDLDAYREARLAWGVFRDRRPDMYGSLLALDGVAKRAPV
jgi:N-carbamoylputrescine amidase